MLCRFENGFPNRLGNRDEQEETFRIEVIIAGFVDDTDLTMLEGIGIRKGKVDLPFLKRNGIAFVVQADHESCWSAFDLVFLSTYRPQAMQRSVGKYD